MDTGLPTVLPWRVDLPMRRTSGVWQHPVAVCAGAGDYEQERRSTPGGSLVGHRGSRAWLLGPGGLGRRGRDAIGPMNLPGVLYWSWAWSRPAPLFPLSNGESNSWKAVAPAMPQRQCAGCTPVFHHCKARLGHRAQQVVDW